MTEEMVIKLPTKPTKQVEVNPKTMIIYGNPKVGKTTILSKLTTQFAPEKSLILNLEPGGSDYVEAVKFDCYENRNPSLPKAKQRYDAIVSAIEKERPYEYLIVDTLTTLDEWSTIFGTFDYMNTPQGKKFNRNEKTGQAYTPGDKEWVPVTDLGNGAGWRFQREWMLNQIQKLSTLAPYVIFVCHIKDKFLGNQDGSEVETKEINLTGKVKDIITAKVDSIAKIFRIGDSCYLSFDSSNSLSGGRCKHLFGEIEISKKLDNGDVLTYWEKVYLNNNNKK